MGSWLKKIRGILGLGGIAGAVGAVLGAGWTAVSAVVGGFGIVWGNVAMGAMVWGLFGAFSGAGFAIALAGLSASTSLDELRLWRAALIGCAVGAAFPLAFNVALGGSIAPSVVIGLLPVMGFCSGLGGLLTGSLVAVAKYAHRAEIRAGGDTAALTDGR